MAAASIQQPSSWTITNNITPTQIPNLLASSPYLESGHLLDLNTVDTQSRLLAMALTNLHTKCPDYATVKYEDSLDLEEVLAELKALARSSDIRWIEQDFYVVEFRSKLKPQIDNALLFTLDKESHREANTSGGLLKYWYGEPDLERRNLATCESILTPTLPHTKLAGFWTDKAAAIAGGKGPLHKQARGIIPKMYESIDVKGLTFTIKDDLSSWTLGPHV
jgi:hypothetical protein